VARRDHRCRTDARRVRAVPRRRRAASAGGALCLGGCGAPRCHGRPVAVRRVDLRRARRTGRPHRRRSPGQGRLHHPHAGRRAGGPRRPARGRDPGRHHGRPRRGRRRPHGAGRADRDGARSVRSAAAAARRHLRRAGPVGRRRRRPVGRDRGARRPVRRRSRPGRPGPGLPAHAGVHLGHERRAEGRHHHARRAHEPGAGRHGRARDRPDGPHADAVPGVAGRRGVPDVPAAPQRRHPGHARRPWRGPGPGRRLPGRRAHHARLHGPDRHPVPGRRAGRPGVPRHAARGARRRAGRQRGPRAHGADVRA